MCSIKILFNRKSKAAAMSIGLWRCCKCGKAHNLYPQEQGQNLIKALECDCPHRSCEDCALTGDIKPFKPVQEPIPVQLSDVDKRILFGIFCGDCGSSWQAAPVSDVVGSRTKRQKISAVPKNLVQHTAHPLDKLRVSRSMANLRGDPTPKAHSPKAFKSTYNLRVLSDEMEKEHGKQANSVMVMFSGIVCTCGRTLTTCDLCFQIVEQPKQLEQHEQSEQSERLEHDAEEPDVIAREELKLRKEPTFSATAEDIAKGIYEPTLTLIVKDRTIHHPNPLKSNPVTKDDLVWVINRGGSI